MVDVPIDQFGHYVYCSIMCHQQQSLVVYVKFCRPPEPFSKAFYSKIPILKYTLTLKTTIPILKKNSENYYLYFSQQRCQQKTASQYLLIIQIIWIYSLTTSDSIKRNHGWCYHQRFFSEMTNHLMQLLFRNRLFCFTFILQSFIITFYYKVSKAQFPSYICRGIVCSARLLHDQTYQTILNKCRNV